MAVATSHSGCSAPPLPSDQPGSASPGVAPSPLLRRTILVWWNSCRAPLPGRNYAVPQQLIPSLRGVVRLLGCFPLAREPASLWVALRHCLSCLEVPPHQAESLVCLPPACAQKLPSLHACYSKPLLGTVPVEAKDTDCCCSVCTASPH